MQKDLADSYPELLDLDLNILKREDLGPFSFKTHVVILEKLKNFWKPFLNHIDGYLNDIEQLDLHNQIMHKIMSTVTFIRDFETDISDPNARHKMIFSNLEDAFRSSVQQYGSLRTIIKEESGDGKETETQSEQFIESLKGRLKQAEGIVKSIESAAGKAGIEAHSKIFGDEADEHRKKALKWLRFTIVLIVAFTALLVALLNLVDAQLLKYNAGTIPTINIFTVQSFAYRFALISLGFISIYFSIKNYNAHRHLQIENEFKENALNTFKAFTKAAGENEDIKNAILLATTHSIFTIPKTGFLGKDGGTTVETPFINLVKSMSGQGS